MCRAVYAVLVADEESAPRLRRAAGLEVQIVGVAATAIDAPTDPKPDVLVLHSSAGSQKPETDAALVWVGDEPPEWADAYAVDDERLSESLPSAIIQALIARRSK